MAPEYEMAVCAVGRDIPTGSDASIKSGSDPEIEHQAPVVERGLSFSGSDGKRRSKWRLIAIVTALFVRVFVACASGTL
jgi:hypothetical protein